MLHADLNGDGRPDAASIRFARSAPARCAFYLRVTTAERSYSLRLGRLVAGNFGKSEWNAPVRGPHAVAAVEAIVDLGGRTNLIALGDQQGASNLFVDFVGLSHGKLRVIPAGLSLYGSVMSESGASCSRGGPLRDWEVFNAGTKKHRNRWGLSLRTFRRKGWSIEAVAHRTTYGSEKQMWRAAKRARLLGQSLSGCSIARNESFR